MGNSDAHPAKTTGTLSSDFENQLKDLIGKGEPGALQAGRVSIIGLDRVKERFGPSWERLAQRADRITRNTIRRYLLPGDIFTDFNETNYVIVFSSLNTEQARIKCLLIANEVMKALLGEEGAELIKVGTVVAQLDGSFKLDEMMSADRMLDVSAAHGVEARIEQKVELATVETALATRTAPNIPRFNFQPMWDTSKAVLSTYMCTPLVGNHYDHESKDDLESTVELDFALLRCVQAELARISSQGCKVLIGASVHFTTLAAGAQRRHYIQLLEQGVKNNTAQLLLIEIADVPDGVPQSRIYELTSSLSRYCRAMVASVRLEATDFSAFRGAKVAAIGCNITGHPASELTIIQLMSRFNRAAEKASLAAYVRGLRTVSLAAAAVGSGYRYIDGHSISETVEHPSRIVKFNLTDIYRSLLTI